MDWRLRSVEGPFAITSTACLTAQVFQREITPLSRLADTLKAVAWRSRTIAESPVFADLGAGVYTLPEAARILGRGSEPVSQRQVRYWLKTGLTPPSYETDYGKALSFHDLISLEIVRRLRNEGVSLQGIRHLEATLREMYPNRDRPLAYDSFFTDGATIWVRVAGDDAPGVIEVGRYLKQYAWPDGVRTFATEIRFGDNDGGADLWTPTKWVELDPKVQFGTPVVRGTRIPVRTIVANLKVGSVAQVADWYGLTRAQVVGAKDYLAAA